MGRRGNREGTIFRRKDGRWQGAISHLGKRVFVYGKTQKEALDKLRKLQAQIDKGINIKAGNYTVESFLELWLNSKESTLSYNTHSLYTHIIEKYINPEIGKIKLKELRASTVQHLYSLKKTYGDSTLHLIHAVLHGALKQAVAWELIPKNPAENVIKPKKSQVEMNYLSQDQAQLILAHLSGTRWEAFYFIAISLGLRRGEMLALTWDDVDWSRKTLRVTKQVVYIKGEGNQIQTPKTQRSSRTLILSNTAIEKLKKHKKLQQLEIAAAENWNYNDLIFCRTNGNAYVPGSITRFHRKLMVKLNMENIRLHDLRHTAATLMLQEGIHPKAVQEIMGHASISITLGIYGHVTPSMREEAANVMDDLLAPIPVQLKK